MSNFLDLIGRAFISGIFLFSGINKIFNFEGTVDWMEGYGVPGILLFPAIAVEILFPILIIIGYKTRIAAGALFLFCLITAFIFHFDFSNQSQLVLFLKNLGLAGGFLFIVANGTKDWAVDREKKYVRL